MLTVVFGGTENNTFSLFWKRMFPGFPKKAKGIVFGCMFSVQPKTRTFRCDHGCDGTVRASIPSTLPWFRRRSFSYLLRNADATISRILNCPAPPMHWTAFCTTLAPSEYYRFNAADHSYLRLVTIFWSSHASDPDDRIQTLEITDDLEGEKKRRELGRIADNFKKKLARYDFFHPSPIAFIWLYKDSTGDPSCFASLRKSYALLYCKRSKLTLSSVTHENQFRCDRRPSRYCLLNASWTRAFSPNHSNATATLRSTFLQHDALNRVMSK